jgi:DNA-binding NarL/FixJ family response regulator
MTTSLGRGSEGIGVVLLEPLGIIRASLRMVFEAEHGMEVIGEADRVEQALEVATTLPTNSGVVVLAGLEFAGELDSYWLIRSIRDRSPQLTILATGSSLDQSAISQALFCGADGFVHKNSSPERFVEATNRAAAGELVLEGLPRGALGGIVDGMEQRRAATPILTGREQMVLVAAADGLTAREIGRQLGVRERTITSHLNNIYRKLGANGRVGALSTALRLGLLSLAPADATQPGEHRPFVIAS